MQFYEDLALQIYGDEPAPLFDEPSSVPDELFFYPISEDTMEPSQVFDQSLEVPVFTPVETSQTVTTNEASSSSVAQGRPRHQRQH